LSAFALKIIALTAMIIDHTGDVYALAIPDSFSLRLIGRIAFPLYAFLIAQGCRHTRDIKKYMLRLGVFALISEIPFDLCFEYPYAWLSFDYQNVFFTLFLSVLAVYAFTSAKGTKFFILGIFAVPACAFAAEQMKTDYGAAGVLTIFFIYIAAENKIAQALAMAAGMAAIYLPNLSYRIYLFNYQISVGLMAYVFSLIPVVLVMFYNGKRGPKLKYFFYAMYPAHLLVLAALQYYPIFPAT